MPSKRSDDAMPTSSDDNKVGGVTTAAGDVKRAPAVVSTPSASAAVARMSKLGTRQVGRCLLVDINIINSSLS